MPRKPRVISKNTIHHIFSRGVEKRKTFMDEIDYKVFIALLKKYKLRFNFEILSYCLMPNHYHLLIKNYDENFSHMMQCFISNYVQYFNKKYGRVGPLFQGRFKSKLIDSDSYYEQIFEYIKNNPVEAGLVLNAESWRWSSEWRKR